MCSALSALYPGRRGLHASSSVLNCTGCAQAKRTLAQALSFRDGAQVRKAHHTIGPLMDSLPYIGAMEPAAVAAITLQGAAPVQGGAGRGGATTGALDKHSIAARLT